MITRLITSISLLISLFEYTAFGAAEVKEEHIEDPLISLQPLPRDLPPHESRRFIIAFNTSPHDGLQLASTLGLLNHDLSTDTDSLFDHKREGMLDDSYLSASKLQELYKACKNYKTVSLQKNLLQYTHQGLEQQDYSYTPVFHLTYQSACWENS